MLCRHDPIEVCTLKHEARLHAACPSALCHASPSPKIVGCVELAPNPKKKQRCNNWPRRLREAALYLWTIIMPLMAGGSNFFLKSVVSPGARRRRVARASLSCGLAFVVVADADMAGRHLVPEMCWPMCHGYLPLRRERSTTSKTPTDRAHNDMPNADGRCTRVCMHVILLPFPSQCRSLALSCRRLLSACSM